jgi:hypothetical protein
LAAFEDAVERERTANEEVVRSRRGRFVVYGEVIQLLHCKSRSWLQVGRGRGERGGVGDVCV